MRERRAGVPVVFLAAVLMAAAACGGGAPAVTPGTPAATPGTPAATPTTPAATPTTPAATPTTPRPTAAPATWHYELDCRDDEDGTVGCVLHRYDAARRDAPGWPVALGSDCVPSYDLTGPVPVGPGDVAYVACSGGDGSPRAQVRAFRPDGSSPAGWPVDLPGRAESPARLAADGTVHVGVSTGEDAPRYFIHAFGPDGVRRPGWPRRVPGGAQGFAVAPDGVVVAWWYTGIDLESYELVAADTWYTMLGPDGRQLAGEWPVRSIGTATEPVIGTDGSLFYVSATSKVWGHDRQGKRLAGWPYELPGAAVPEVRPDGNLLFVVQEWGICPMGVEGVEVTPDDCTADRATLVVLRPDGTDAPGWPVELPGSVETMSCATPGPSWIANAVGPDSTLYLIVDGASVIAVDAAGRTVPGWPYALPAGWPGTTIRVEPDGRLQVGLRQCSGSEDCCGDGASDTTLIIDVSAVGPTPVP